MYARVSQRDGAIAAIAVESAVKFSFVLKGIQTMRNGQCNAELTLSTRLCVKPLITAITAICSKIRKNVPYHGDSPNTTNGAGLHSVPYYDS